MFPSLATRLQSSPYAIQTLIVLTLAISFVMNIWGLLAGISIVTPHLFYIPLVLAAFFYPRRGVIFSIAVSVGYLLLVFLTGSTTAVGIEPAAARCIVFVFIAAVVSYLSGRIENEEAALVQARDEWESTFNSIPDLIAVIGTDHRIIRINRAMADRLGIAPEKAVGLPCFEAVHSSREIPGSCPMTLLLRDGMGHTTEVHEERLGGDYLVTVSPIRDNRGALTGIIHVARDITERKRVEDALRESEERYRAIIENIEDVFFRFDRDSRLVMVSPSAGPVFGYASAEEMIGLPATALWKDSAERTRMIETMRSSGGFVRDWEAELKKRDGTVFWASISGHLHLNADGRYMGKEGIIRDISDRKKAEDALKAALTKLNMLSSITRHDILNQVMGLRTFLELSLDDLRGTQHEPYLKNSEQAAVAIQRQIEFTRYYQDIGVNAPAWQDVFMTISEAAGGLTLTGIDIDIGIRGVEIFADRLIVKVFFNLMENSLRHGERVTEMSFASHEKPVGLVITYRDNGVGISDADKKKLFQKGFGKHTGLGLFLSREILAITGITITENGEPGKGVRFEITVPHGAFRFTSQAD